MAERMTVYTKISPSYQYSSELSLALGMFRAAFPPGTAFFVAGEDSVRALRELIEKHISGTDGYVCIVKEPAALIGKGTVGELVKTLQDHPNLSCVLPSDIRGYRAGRAADYYTMRGFERFAASLHDPDGAIAPYDGREPWMFLIRNAVLKKISVPEDPLKIPSLLEPGSVSIALNAYIHPFINYYQETRSDLLPYLPAGLKSLLDIGCTKGYFGATVKKERGCRVVGLEINLSEAAEARARLDRVIEGDIFAADVDEMFDCVTCLDVIEHFVEPESFLQKVKTFLYDNGHLVLSIPNVGHWSVVEDLIAGRWDYAPAGTVCISHLRFFTKKTIEKMLGDNGFRIVHAGEETTPLTETALKSIHLLKEAGFDVDEKSLASLRYYIAAQKSCSGGSQ